MWRTALIYGLAMALLFGLLKYIEYSFFVRDLPIEIYIGIIAAIFAVLGIWAGRRLVSRSEASRAAPAPEVDRSALLRLGISKREYEVLELIAQGLSNQEIADKLFVSTSTVKTHISNIYSKLDARRRTEAIKRAKELRLLS